MTPFTVQDLDGTLDPGAWTPMTAPVDCDGLTVSNRGGAALLSIRGVTGTDVFTVGAGAEQALAPAPPRANGRLTAAGVPYRYRKGSVVGYLQPASGTGIGSYLLWA